VANIQALERRTSFNTVAYAFASISILGSSERIKTMRNMNSEVATDGEAGQISDGSNSDVVATDFEVDVASNVLVCMGSSELPEWVKNSVADMTNHSSDAVSDAWDSLHEKIADGSAYYDRDISWLRRLLNPFGHALQRAIDFNRKRRVATSTANAVYPYEIDKDLYKTTSETKHESNIVNSDGVIVVNFEHRTWLEESETRRSKSYSVLSDIDVLILNIKDNLDNDELEKKFFNDHLGKILDAADCLRGHTKAICDLNMKLVAYDDDGLFKSHVPLEDLERYKV